MKSRAWILSLICLVHAACATAASAPPSPSTPSQYACTTTYKGNTVDGSKLWTEVPNPTSAIDCEFHQFGWNNFLYLVTDVGGHPRFMSWAPWYDAIPATGSPKWPGGYNPLDGTQLKKKQNQVQAGDDFELIDVAQGVTAYDIRINSTFFGFIQDKGVYTKAALAPYIQSYAADPINGGLWLPASNTDSPGDGGSIEIKTAWRDFGTVAGTCPESIMHCETDSAGNIWGLTGLHLVQKTPDHGEFIWTSFEHFANAPDCAGGGSNPLQQDPEDPTNRSATLNVNENVGSVEDRTGWSYFDFTTYKANSGDGTSCDVPDGAYTYASGGGTCGKASGTPICNTSPVDGSSFKRVDICRTDGLPKAAVGCVNTPDEGTSVRSRQNVSCLNQSVLDNFPSGVDSKWKYYSMIGTQWLYSGASNLGAGVTGCFAYDDGPAITGQGYQKTLFGNYCEGKAPGEDMLAHRGDKNLASSVMETWLQKDLCLPKSSTDSSVLTQAQDCFSCHSPQTQTYEAGMSHLFGRITQAGSARAVLELEEGYDGESP